MNNEDLDTTGAAAAYLGASLPDRARASMASAVNTQPDFEARARKLAADAGMPVSTARAMPEDANRRAVLNTMDFDEMAKRLPSTMEFLAKGDNARIVHDDVGSMGNIERLVRSLGGAAEYLTSHPGRKNTLMGDIGAGLQRADRGAAGVFQAASEFAAKGAEGLIPALRINEELGVAGGNPLRRLAEGFGNIGARNEATAKEMSPPQTDVVGGGVSSGVQSLVQNALALPLALLPGGQSAALTIMSSGAGGQAYQQAREQGMSPERALPFAASQAAIEYATEKLPLARLIGDVKQAAPLWKTLAHQAGLEIPGEQIATILQDLNEWAVLPENKSKTFKDYLAERPNAAAQTLIATVVGVGGQVMVMHALDGTINGAEREAQRAEKAEADAKALELLARASEASKVRTRDATTFKAFVDQVAQTGDAPTELYIDPATLANSLNQSGMTVQELEAVAPVAMGELQRAAATGTDVRVPVAEFAALGETVTAPLIDHLRTDPEAMTRAEADEFLKTEGDTIKAQVEQALTTSDEQAAYRKSIEQVRDVFQQQLAEAKRFTGSVNQAYADLLANFFGAQAARAGMTPQQLLQKYRLDVVAQGTGGKRTLNQSQRPRAEQSVDESGMPEIRGEGIEIRYAQPTERFEVIPAEGHQLFNMAIMSPEGDYLGYVELGYDNGKPSALYDIEVDNSTRTKGIGSKVIEAILAANPEADILISNVVPAARGFWEKVGIPQQNVGEGDAYDGTLNWNTYADSQAGRKSLQARRDSGQGGGDSRGTKDGSGPAAGGVLEQGSEQVGPRAQIAFGDDITAAPSVISLLAGADLSSFIHESGHFFLEVQSDLAIRIQQQIAAGSSVGPGERGIVDDMNRLLAWFGVKGDENQSALDVWAGMTLEEKREHHEKFARGFEAYSMEGKAPSLDLQGVFQRFRSWLVQVYKTLKSLNVELTDDVRAVMDRMLATDTAIAEAEAQRNMGALFRDAKTAGMTLEEFNAYQATAQAATESAKDELQARSMADMKWMSRARNKALKERQAEVEELRKQARREVTAEVLSQPVYRAWQFLSGRADEVDVVEPGSLPVGEIDTTTKKGKLRTSALKEIAPETWEVLSKRRMTSEDAGMHPEIVAELFGFDSGDALVQALVEARPPREVIADLTDQRMLEQHGDITSPAALQRAADEAVHNEARARFITAELKALAAANDVKEKQGARSVDVLAKAAKQFATQIIDRLKVRDIRPAKYAAAEVRNGKMAEKAFAKGDLEEAAQHKRNQLVNNYATRAAYEAQKEVAAAVKYFRRFDKRSKTIDPDYMDQIEALLARFDLGSISLKELSRRKSLLAWVESQRAQGIEPEIAPELLNEAYRQSYKDMTVEEIRGLRDTVKQIEHLGRVKNRLLTARDKRTYEQIRDEITSSINENAGDRTADTRTPDTALGRWLEKVKKFGAEHIKAAAWARILDGGKDGGPVWEHFVRGANERGDMETTMRAEATKALSEIMAPVLKAGKMSAKTFFPSINRSLTREAVFAIALNTGNQSNLQRLLGGEGWSIGQLQPILDTLSAQDWQAVQAVWDHFESYRPQIAAKQRRVYGSEPDWIDPSPVVTKFGTLKGGYFPVKYDPNASVRAEEHADAEAAAQQLRGAYTSATTRRSFTKSRAEEVVGRPLLYTLQGLYGGVNEVIHDLAWHEWLIDANRLLRSDAIDTAIRSHYGPQVVRQFKTWVEAIAEGDSASNNALEMALGTLRQNVSVAGLGYNAVTAATQFLGAPQSIARIGVKWFGLGLQQYVAHPIAKTREVNAKSDFMANRARTRFRELNELRNRVQGDDTIRQAVISNAYVMMMRTQQMVDVPTWLGAYEKAVSEGNGEDRAIALADQAVIDAQGGGQTKDLSAIERGGPALKIYTSFYSFMNTQLNLLVSRGMTNHSAAKTVADVLLVSIVPSMLMVLLENALIPGDSGDEDDKLLRKLASAGLEGLFGLFVLGREFSQLASMAAGLNDTALGYTGPSGLRLINDLYKFGKEASQGDLDDGFRKASINVMGSLLGLPSAQINRVVTGGQALSEGKTENPAALVFGYQEPR